MNLSDQNFLCDFTKDESKTSGKRKSPRERLQKNTLIVLKFMLKKRKLFGT